MKEYRILFAPSMKETVVDPGKSVLEAARQAGVYIDSPCNGTAKCGKCRVRVMEGSVSGVTAQEAEFVSNADQKLGYRLACMTHPLDDLTVLISGEDILVSDATKKIFSGRSTIINPAVRNYTIDIPGEDGRPAALIEGAKTALASRYGLKQELAADLPALQQISQAVKEDKGTVTALVWEDREIIGIQPGSDLKRLGLALDIGTTTVALYVCDLRNGYILSSGSVTNPQALFGAEVMSRIAYSANHRDGTKRMQQELMGSVNVLIARMAAKDGFSAQQIVDATVVGNTVMHHIFLGIAPDRLGLWPFTPSVQSSVKVKARDLGIRIDPSSYVHVLPIEAGFVGADNVGVLLSAEPYNKDEVSLIIDLGTNGEVVLGNRERLLCCSCATGPAFEGAHISCGMRAMPGAIEKVRIDPATFEVDYAVVGTEGWASEHEPGHLRPVGLCGSGIIDTVAHLFRAEIIGEDGAFLPGRDMPRLRTGASGVKEIVVAWGGETATGRDIVLTQKDIRQVQLAKAALHAACRILVNHLRIESITRMVIAGAFGMHIDKENALAIGLFPWCDPENIGLVGNAAGHGAYLALIDKEKRKEADRIARSVTHIELAREKDFQREFLNALSIPHKKH